MTTAIVWFKQDLRLTDNPAFFEACSKHTKVIPLYILDGKNSALGPAQAWWLHHSLNALEDSLNKKLGLKLILRKGNPLEIILELVHLLSIKNVYWNRSYEPEIIERDKKIKFKLKKLDVNVLSFNASLFNEPWTIKNKSGDFFKVFTPYWRTCKQNLVNQPLKELSQQPNNVDIMSDDIDTWQLLPDINWACKFHDFWTPGEQGAQQRLDEFISCNLQEYNINRNFPEKQATSRLSPHLHFGEISPWTILRAIELAKIKPNCNLTATESFLSELGWREFSYYLLYHIPSLPHKNVKNEFDTFPWNKDESLFQCWKQGMTGYPIVDAGMRELWATGYMHNRVRMITASFLTKDLLIDWRLGAAWFLNTLVDADLANNSASWQWVAGCGADAAPYFRIFNPILQSRKFDPNGNYIRRWVPELSSLTNDEIHAPWEKSDSTKKNYTKINYPKPIVDHGKARATALMYYNQLKKNKV